MFIPAIADFFRYKVAGSIIVLVCWSAFDEVKHAKEFSRCGMKVTFSCDPAILDRIADHQLQGVLYIEHPEQPSILAKVKRNHFAHRYKWLLITEEIPNMVHGIRYDSDVTLLKEEIIPSTNFSTPMNDVVFFDDIYVHPRDGASVHGWASWTAASGFQVTGDWYKIRKRKNLDQYPFRIAAPVAHYSEDIYQKSFAEYLVDMTVADAGLRCGYAASSLLIEAIKAKEVLLPVHFWVSDKENNSTLLTLGSGSAELSAGPLRMQAKRQKHLDYVLPIWLFSVGFTYLAERESSSNMYVEPFTVGVWWSCLVVGLILAAAQRAASRQRREKDGAYIAVLATLLQQDADAVPEGIAGRWTFTVLSVCSMLVHAYYTSAIVSALMSTGRGGPKNLRALADSKYAIASEDHDFIRQTMFSVETNWTDLEYLKKKKMTSKFYQEILRGVQLMQQGTTAYHSEYHQIYHYLDTLSDDDVCKMQHVDTISEIMTWVATTVRGQWTNVLRSAGAWLYETGLARRLILRGRLQPPQCRSALLAERVKFGDVAPLLALTTLGVMASLCLLALEILVAKYVDPRKKTIKTSSQHDSQNNFVAVE